MTVTERWTLRRCPKCGRVQDYGACQYLDCRDGRDGEITEAFEVVPAEQFQGAVSLLDEARTLLHEAGDLVAGGNLEKDIRALCDRIDAHAGGQ